MKKTRIMVFGTFDGLHLGHLDFFSQARNLAKNPFLIVSVARDINVKKIKLSLPRFSERQRQNFVKKTRKADKVVLGGKTNPFPHIVKMKPAIIALGYDQKAYTKGLKQGLQKNGLKFTKIVRLKPFFPKFYKSSILRKSQFKKYAII